MEVDERHKICQLIEAMLAADGAISPVERDFLQRVVERFGLPDRDGVPFLDSAESDVGRSTQALRTLTPDVRLRVMALLVDAAVVDGVVAPEERALLMASAATLGIEATALEERIAGRMRSGVSVSPRPPVTSDGE